MSPTGQERRFPAEYAKTLLRIADGDLRSADFASAGVETGDVRPENVLFLYQQSIEKALKAALCSLSLPIPLVHDLGALLAKFPQAVQPPYGYEIGSLSEYAGLRRDEEGSYAVEQGDIDDAASIARTMLDWARSVVDDTQKPPETSCEDATNGETNEHP